MVAARSARELSPFTYENIINAIDWHRVLIQARGLHRSTHIELSIPGHVCGECIKVVLLRTEE